MSHKTVAEIGTLARSHCKHAIHVVQGIMNNDESTPQVRLQAAQVLFDRGLCKPAQAVTVDVTKTITVIERRIVDVIDVDHEVVSLPTKSDT